MSVQAGYNQQQEDNLFAAIGWPRDGYRLFEIATLDESSLDGWFFPIQESNALFMKCEMWAALGGVDERFDAPGGGLLNLDMFQRAMELPGARLVKLLGEGTFHQLHGGTATNSPIQELHENLSRWADQYAEIRGRSFTLSIPEYPPTFIGVLPRAALIHLLRAAIDPVWPTIWPGTVGVEPPLGLHFNRELWSCNTPKRPDDPRLAAILDLAHAEFRADRYDSVASLARLMYSHSPMEPEPRRLLALVCGWLLEGDKGMMRSPEYHRAQSKAYEFLGEHELAAPHKMRVHSSKMRQRLKPIAGAVLDLLSSLRHPIDNGARQQIRVRLQSKLSRSINRLLRIG
jgi:hypothetical protein